jgi:hypothetical protein
LSRQAFFDSWAIRVVRIGSPARLGKRPGKGRLGLAVLFCRQELPPLGHGFLIVLLPLVLGDLGIGGGQKRRAVAPGGRGTAPLPFGEQGLCLSVLRVRRLQRPGWHPQIRLPDIHHLTRERILGQFRLLPAFGLPLGLAIHLFRLTPTLRRRCKLALLERRSRRLVRRVGLAPRVAGERRRIAFGRALPRPQAAAPRLHGAVSIHIHRLQLGGDGRHALEALLGQEQPRLVQRLLRSGQLFVKALAVGQVADLRPGLLGLGLDRSHTG